MVSAIRTACRNDHNKSIGFKKVAEVVVVQTLRLPEQERRGELAGEERQDDGDAYNGVIAIIPATILVLTKYEIGRIAMASSASISSLIRMAPS